MSHNGRRQFSELARHLFCAYPVPEYLESAWFAGNSAEARKAQDIYMRVGNGVSLRQLGLPFTLTKRMAHIALTDVPTGCSVVEGWRWAQIVGMGGSERLTRALVATLLGVRWQCDEPFWETVIRFFVDNPLLDPAQVGPLVDYLHHERTTPHRPGDADRLPAGFTMKGRTVGALLQRMEQWHRQLATVNRATSREWKTSGLPGYVEREPDPDSGQNFCWTISELTTAKELAAEGAAMSHCVGSYAHSCMRGDVSVWSVKVQREDRFESERVMTVAVSRGGHISEARGKRNALPGGTSDSFGKRMSFREAALLSRARRIVRAWANARNLRLPPYLV